ncbi:hypothetical protein J4410_04030 [Candidatus Woesearchaeota archaeon]|nr:hypothetical protein [Candidatus Woesearchaeota archaeon]
MIDQAGGVAPFGTSAIHRRKELLRSKMVQHQKINLRREQKNKEKILTEATIKLFKQDCFLARDEQE